MQEMALKRTILYDWQVVQGARIVEFAGWQLPLYYSSIMEEHQAVRTAAGLFELNYMGRFRISGRDSTSFLNYIITNDVEALSIGQVQYSLICNTRGGIIDDITVYRTEDFYLLVVNAINTDIVLSWLNQHRSQFGNVNVEDISLALGMIALQGPKAEAVLQPFVADDLSAINYYHFIFTKTNGVRALISRTGYTGEDGFEIYLSTISIPGLWTKLLSAGKDKGLLPVGLGARDTLRLEACFPLYGNELNIFTTPVEAGLGKFVKLEKPDFVGRKSLLHSTTSEFARRLVAFEMEDRSVPRKDCTVIIDETPLGKVTSGTFSPTLRKGIGLAYVAQYKSAPETKISIIIHRNNHPGVIVKKPFYKGSVGKSV